MGVDPLSWALFAVAAVSAGASVYEGQKAASANQQAVALQRQQNDIVAARQQRDAVRQARIASANTEAAAERQGVGFSSSAQGGQGSIVSQLSDSLSFLDKYNMFSDQASAALGRAEQYKANENSFGQVANAAMSLSGKAPQISRGLSAVASKVFGGGG